jgi:hypothetical protein
VLRRRRPAKVCPRSEHRAPRADLVLVECGAMQFSQRRLAALEGVARVLCVLAVMLASVRAPAAALRRRLGRDKKLAADDDGQRLPSVRSAGVSQRERYRAVIRTPLVRRCFMNST